MWTEGLAPFLGHVWGRVTHFLHLLPRCSGCRRTAPGLQFSFVFQTSLALRHAQMHLLSRGQGYWSFFSLLLLQPCFCWASLNWEHAYPLRLEHRCGRPGSNPFIKQLST